VAWQGKMVLADVRVAASGQTEQDCKKVKNRLSVRPCYWEFTGDTELLDGAAPKKGRTSEKDSAGVRRRNPGLGPNKGPEQAREGGHGGTAK